MPKFQPIPNFDSLAPTTTKGDLIVNNGTNNVRVGVGSDTQVLIADSSQSAGIKWGAAAGATAPTVQTFLQSLYYTFTVTSANATVGATYTNNSKTFTVVYTIAGGTTLVCSATGTPTASGTLTKATGSGDATITFSAQVANGTYQRPTGPTPLYIRIKMVGGGAGGGPSGSSGGTVGGTGGSTTFGTSTAAGGAGGGINGGPTAGGSGTLGAGLLGFAIAGGSGGAMTTAVSGSGGGGSGGNSAFGGGGGGGGSTGFLTCIAGATNTGGGGGGDVERAGFGGSGGGAGGYVEATITSPSATYTFTVGAGGAGGSAGAGGLPGAAGGSGIIIVEEFYQ